MVQICEVHAHKSLALVCRRKFVMQLCTRKYQISFHSLIVLHKLTAIMNKLHKFPLILPMYQRQHQHMRDTNMVIHTDISQVHSVSTVLDFHLVKLWQTCHSVKNPHLNGSKITWVSKASTFYNWRNLVLDKTASRINIAHRLDIDQRKTERVRQEIPSSMKTERLYSTFTDSKIHRTMEKIVR